MALPLWRARPGRRRRPISGLCRGQAQAREFVDGRKQHRLRLAAQLYLAQHPTALQPRFDVAEVYAPQGTATKNPEIRYWENAFW